MVLERNGNLVLQMNLLLDEVISGISIIYLTKEQQNLPMIFNIYQYYLTPFLWSRQINAIIIINI